MWELVMIIVVGYGYSTYGGPLVVDGFKTKEACMAHAEKIKAAIPQEFERRYSNTVNRVEFSDCIKKEI